MTGGFPRTAPLGARVAAIGDGRSGHRDGDGVVDELLPALDTAPPAVGSSTPK
jgi:hypothetical protein